jgi:hypothetical protein
MIRFTLGFIAGVWAMFEFHDQILHLWSTLP